jgi:hypothetical protein
MKKNLIHLFLTALMVLFILSAIYAQDPPPPPGDPSGSGGNPPVGGGTPVGSGLVMLLALAAGYGFRIYRLKKS